MNTTTRWPSVDRSPTPTGWARPANLMPADVPRSWPRGRRAASEAEEILATAEAWWDVDRSNFRDGDRYLRNMGTAGSALDLRLGSSGVANSNDPKWLGPEDTGYVYLPGVVGNHLSTSLTTLSSVASVDFAVRVSLDSFASVNWLSGWNSTHAAFWIQSNKTLIVRLLNTSILSIGEIPSNIAVPDITAGQPVWLRGKVTVATSVCDYWYSYDQTNDESLVSWISLGTPQTGGNAGTTPLLSQSGSPIWGSHTSGSAGLTGKFHAAAERIDGTIRQRIDADAITSGAATSFVATTSQTVTINRATSGRKSVAMPSKAKGGRPLMLLGTDDYLECLDAAQHGLLNFGQGDSFTVLAVARRWATQVSAARIIVKLDASLTAPNGWSVANFSTGQFNNVVLSDGPNIINTGTTTAAWIAGTLTTNGMIVDRVARTLRPIINATIHTSTSTAAVGSAANTQTVRIGRSSGVGTSYADMEFTAAAVFRRALTAREITVIANAAPWGV